MTLKEKTFEFKDKVMVIIKENLSVLIIVLFLGLFGVISLIILSANFHFGRMFLFSGLFIITFVLVANYHEKQLTIILVAASIALLLATVFFEGFLWEMVIVNFVEWEVLAVVFGMSMLVGATTKTGIFDWLIIITLRISKGRIFPLYILTFLVTFSLSTVLANVTAMLLISAMILTVCTGLDYDPTPFLMTAVLATALAGMTTLVSSLPSIMVGTAAGIGFLEFLIISLPFVLVCIPICIFYIKWFYPPEKVTSDTTTQTIDLNLLNPWDVIEDRRAFNFAAVSLIITVIGFTITKFLGIPIGVMAILCGILSIVLTGISEQELIPNMNWDTLLFFAGLFVLVGTLEQTEVLLDIAGVLLDISQGDLFFAGFLILIIATVVSGVLDNIPVTATLIPIVLELNRDHVATNPFYLWFVLVFSGALGGGWTPFGSASGILAISILSKEGRPVSFKEYMKCFIPISVFLALLGDVYLSILAIIGLV
ncbi:MAG: SLC13 family permease [Candidatus Thorarchaeota archaeon]